MYLNEKSWEIQGENPYGISEAIKEFLQICKEMFEKFHIAYIYVPSEEEPYLRSAVYTISKWLSEVDIEYKRLYLSFWNKRVVYEEEGEFELSYQNEVLRGGTQAVINDSFMISVGFSEKWKKNKIQAQLFSLAEDKESEVIVPNLYQKEQLMLQPFAGIMQAVSRIQVYSYEELWERRTNFFPHLVFCPSVKKDMDKLETSYLHQIIRKLQEIDCYVEKYGTKEFRPELLTKTTLESERTLEQYQKEHTFRDEIGREYLVSWHMRYTGMSGRIFFVPTYAENKMLICYIGKKLPNVTYS